MQIASGQPKSDSALCLCADWHEDLGRELACVPGLDWPGRYERLRTSLVLAQLARKQMKEGGNPGPNVVDPCTFRLLRAKSQRAGRKEWWLRSPEFVPLADQDWQAVEELEAACFTPPMSRDQIRSCLKPIQCMNGMGCKLCRRLDGYHPTQCWLICVRHVCRRSPSSSFGCLPPAREQDWVVSLA